MRTAWEGHGVIPVGVRGETRVRRTHHIGNLGTIIQILKEERVYSTGPPFMWDFRAK